MKVTRISYGMMWILLAALLPLLSTAVFAQGKSPKSERDSIPGGEVLMLGDKGQQAGVCPLKHTDVVAAISGYVCRTTVKQTFHNPLNKKIEAVYVFPLPQNSAVDDMTMTIGKRRIQGQIKPREQARQIYEKAKASGHVASLLDQERPNIFTQAVANIEPGAEIVIEIAFTETLKYEDANFEWVFPMVVGPRYMPGAPTGQAGTGWSPDTAEVPDASKISPPVTPEGTRAGHDISLVVNIDTGMGLQEVNSELHEIEIKKTVRGRATVTLKNQNTIPNKDFILRYRTATDKIEDALLTHSDGGGHYFTLVLQPPRRVTRAQAVPRELIFVLDTSGSMSGFPIEKAKSVMAKSIDSMGDKDTFNLITFAGDTSVLWAKPRPNTTQNRAAAQAFLATRAGGGGTEMMKAINAALEGQKTGHIRIVCFMTDGYVGNDREIIAAIKKNAGTARVFAFGIGNSVNRYLLDGMARAGRGEVEYVTLAAQGDAAATRFYERINAPVLTDIALDWGKLSVQEVYPKQYPDLFSTKPIMIHGQLKSAAEGTIILRGNTAAGRFERKVRIDPQQSGEHEA
ncbi:MAG TPA: VIT domain-containing protein, partial [Abditibacteriaceae bacterium]|nr:VIT domain-containing protein [Abditibacteriaceae bacterium]